MAHDDPFGTTVSTAHRWLNEIGQAMPEDAGHRSHAVLRAVLHAIRDRVGSEVGAHFAAQLPTLVRGIYYEGYDPTHDFVRLTAKEFVARIEADALLKGTSETEDAIRAVTSLLWRELTPGIMEHLLAVLPADYAELF